MSDLVILDKVIKHFENKFKKAFEVDETSLMLFIELIREKELSNK